MGGSVIEKVVPDTSVLIEGLLSEKIQKKEITLQMVIIHEAALAELEYQANQGKAVGFLGLEEIQRLRSLSGKEWQFHIKGVRPRPQEIRHASLGEIDALIRQLAFDEDGTLLTSDLIQKEVASAKGMKVLFYEMSDAGKKLKFERFFDETTMSVHLREGVEPHSKRGRPGAWEFSSLRKALLKQEEIQEMTREIIEFAKLRKDGFVEIERAGSTIVQLGSYRIVITKPPFSDGWEITAVRPVKRLVLDEYQLSEKLRQRISEQAEGILVAGAPGMGKSTFVQALAGYYASQSKVIKTVEAPRDLVLPEKVTQYAISYGDAAEVHDILLLSRPDYTLFDEMRNTEDFKLFADLRLAGVGMVGVVHATNPVDAIQRFLGRVEMGVIPQIVDTVLFIKNGGIESVLSLSMTVKVPSGMTEADLARPVVVINDFESEKLVYEIYSYGEQTVVVPVTETPTTGGVHKLAGETIKQSLAKYASDIDVDVISNNKCVVTVPEKNVSRIIGKQGSTIAKIEEQLGMSIDVRSKEHKEEPKQEGKEVPYEIRHKKNAIILDLGMNMQHKDVDLYLGEEFLATTKAGKTGLIKVKKTNEHGKAIMDALHQGEKIRLVC